MKGLLTLLVWLCCGFAMAAPAREYTVREVPNTRYYSDTIHISDPDDWITEEYQAKIDHVLSTVRDEADVFVVVLSSIGDDNIEEFANDLFNFWGIGERDRNNGVLMLMVEDQHKLRFETGYGMEETMPDALCLRIFNDIIRPYFKEGDYNEGLYAGVCAVAGVLGQLPEDAAVDRETIELIKRSEEEEPWGFWDWLLVIAYCLCSLFLVCSFGIRIFKQAKVLKSDQDGEATEKAYKEMKTDALALLLSCIACVPTLPLALAFASAAPFLRMRYRKHTRQCSCGQPMRRLSESEEDPYLNENQLFEERLKVKDYDVWYCDACHSTKILGYSLNKAQLFFVCPSCHCLAGKKQYDSTVVSPTLSSTGEGLHHIACQKCGHEFTISYVIPKKSESSSGSGSSWGSSGGGSFGGGSSGGGGATGSW